MNNNRQKLPEGWAITYMGEVSEVIGGGTPSSKVSDNFDEKSGYPWITPADLSKFTDIYIKRGRRFLTEKGLNSCSARLVPEGSVLLSSRAPIGYVAVAANELCTSQGFKSFVCHEGLESEFIYYWLLYKRKELQKMGSGSTFAELSGSRAKQIPLSISPTREQEIISEVLKKLFARVNITKDRLDKAAETMKRFRKSVLNSACTGKLTEDWRELHLGIKPAAESLLEIKEERQKKATTKTKQQRIEEIYSENETRIVNDLPLTWKIVRLEKVCESFQYGTSQKSLNSGKIPVLRMGNLKDGRINWDNLKYSNDDEEIKKYWLEPNTVLFNRTNSPKLVGKTSIFRGEHEAIYAGYLIKINNYRDYLDSMYLNCCMNTEYIRANCLKVKRDGISQSNINATKLAGFEIALPPFEEQQEIVRQVGRLSDLANSIERRVKTATEKTEKLTQAILSKAFRGELVPTEAELARIEGRDYETAKELLGRVAKAKAAEANNKEKKQMKRQLSVKHKKQPVRGPLLEVIRKNPEGITPENLLRMANYTIEEIDDFYCDLSNIMQEIEEVKPSGSQAKKWLINNNVLIKPKKV